MLKLAFISFYDIKEYILSLKLAFELHLYTIENYPLYRFAYDENDKIENYPSHLVKYLQKIEPDIVFWIFLDVDIDVFKMVRSSLKKETKLVMYLADQTSINDVFLVKLSYFDYVLTHHINCLEDIAEKSDFSIDKILYLPPCYDNLLFNNKVKIVDKYKTDLVYLGYNYNDQIENMLVRLSQFSKKNNLKFRLHGTSQFRTLFSEYYASNYSYLEQPLIYAASRLVICDDPVQVMRVFAHGKLFAGVGIKMSNFTKLYIGEHNQIDFDKLEYILQNSSLILNDMSLSIEQMIKPTYSHTVEVLHQKICLDAFNQDFYLKNFYPNEVILDAKQHYLEKGYGEKIVPFKFSIPKGFDDQSYLKTLKDNQTRFIGNRYYLFYHWKKFCNDLAYIKEEQLDLGSLVTNAHNRPNITFTNMCKIFKIMIDLYQETTDKDELLSRLAEIAKENPNVDMTLCLKMFFQWRDQVCSLYLEKNESSG